MHGIPLNRSQLISTFGAGSLVVNTKGESALIASLDNWYYDSDGNMADDITDFEIHEPRLRSLVQVDKLLAPPDYRENFKYKNRKPENNILNEKLIIPLQRFPKWHYCSNCGYLKEFHTSVKSDKVFCDKCNKKQKFIQVPFVMVCTHGHISDFPWKEWVHHTENPTCGGDLSLKQSGGATLDSLVVHCSCGKSRPLKNITGTSKTQQDSIEALSYIAKNLNADNSIYKCPGEKPWQGIYTVKEDCNASPYAALKNSTNVYFPNTISALYLPGNQTKEVEEASDIIRKSVSPVAYSTEKDSATSIVKNLKKYFPRIGTYNDDVLEKSILFLNESLKNSSPMKEPSLRNANLEIRCKEYIQLINNMDSSYLKIINEHTSASESQSDIMSYFSKINRVPRLKETIVQIGFSRLGTLSDSTPEMELLRGKNLLFKNSNLPNNNWLPAYEVFGEGIFFEVADKLLSKWLNNQNLINHIESIKDRFSRSNSLINILDTESIAKAIMIHTLSHILINQLALTCGYNTVSLRERIYAGENQQGFLIYTSSGDSEGTMGGLVRMGKKDNIFPEIQSALEKAMWCSSDPICTEIGLFSGQGVNHLNGAACHSCAYLPETSCEHMNTYLDRSLLIAPDYGFFRNLLH